MDGEWESLREVWGEAGWSVCWVRRFVFMEGIWLREERLGPEGLGSLDLVAQGGDYSRSQRIITCWEALCVGALL